MSERGRHRGQRLWLAALTLLLSACGFHLAGQQPVPDGLQKVYIDTVTPYKVGEPPVETQLRAILQRRGVQVLSSPNNDATTIRLSKLSESREVLSIGTDGKALEFRVVTRLHYEVFKGPQTLMLPGDLVASRDYSFEPSQLLAKEAEELRLRSFIQNELAELLMLRIDAGLRHPAIAAPAAPADAAPAP